jgi:hypothetical protein
MTTDTGMATVSPKNRHMIIAPDASGTPNKTDNPDMGYGVFRVTISEKEDESTARTKNVNATLAIRSNSLL